MIQVDAHSPGDTNCVSSTCGLTATLSSASSLTVTLSSDQSVRATFTLQHELTVTAAGSGLGGVASNPPGISCPSACSSAFDQTTLVTLTATAGAGSAFAGWSGGGCSGTGTCTVTMSSDQTVTATFTLQPEPSATGTRLGFGHRDGPGLHEDVKLESAKAAAAGMHADACRRARVGRTRVQETARGKLEKIAPQRTLKLTARCDQAAKLTLTGKLTSVPKASKGDRHPKPRVFEIRAVSAAARGGVPLKLTVKLSAGALAPGSHDSVTFALSATNANGSSTATARIARLILFLSLHIP